MYSNFIGKCTLLKYFHLTGKPRKLNTRAFVYSTQFMYLIIVDFHNPQKYFNVKMYTWKISHKNFTNYGILMKS